MDNSMISVIVPVYNTEKYLFECVESLLKQTYQNFELILVDDGSTDNCGKICDEYSLKDERIKVIHKINGGLSSAWNAGIKEAKGSYLSFIDSDDYVDKKFLESMYHCLMEKKADICECSFFYLKDNKRIPEKLFRYEILDNVTAVKYLFTDSYGSYVVTWNKLYKKKLFNQIRFPEGKLHEDEFTTYKLLYESKQIAYLNQHLYNYRIRKGSIMTSGFSMKRAEILKCIGEMKNYFKFHNVDMQNEIGFHEFSLQILLLNTMIESNNYNIELWNNIKHNLNKNRKKLFRSPYLKKHHKIYLATLLLGKNIYIVFWKSVKIIKELKRNIFRGSI